MAIFKCYVSSPEGNSWLDEKEYGWIWEFPTNKLIFLKWIHHGISHGISDTTCLIHLRGWSSLLGLNLSSFSLVISASFFRKRHKLERCWKTQHPISSYIYIYIWVWVNTYRYIFSGMNIHLPAILGFTRYQGFDPSPYIYIYIYTTDRLPTG